MYGNILGGKKKGSSVDNAVGEFIGTTAGIGAALNTLPNLSGLVINPLCGHPLQPPGLAESKDEQECTPSNDAAFSIVAWRL